MNIKEKKLFVMCKKKMSWYCPIFNDTMAYFDACFMHIGLVHCMVI